MATDVPVGEPLGVSVMLVPLMVTGPTLLNDALLASTRVSDSDAPLQALGIAPSAMLVTTLAVEVHDIVMPDSDPHELTLALAPTTLVEFAVVPSAIAPLGTLRTSAPTAARAAARDMAA